MSRIAKDGVGKGLRQRIQTKRWNRHQEAITSGDSALPTVHSPQDSLVRNKVLQNAFLGNVPPTALQKKFRNAVQASTSKSNAVEAFLLLASATNGSVSRECVQALSSSLVKLQVKEDLGEAAYRELLQAAVGSDDERWRDISPEEESIFATYERQKLERHAERGSGFNKELGMKVEGSDNEKVALIEFQLRRHTNDSMVPVSNDTLVNLMHLDISWLAALRLLQYARELSPEVPPNMEMLDRVTGLMTGYKSNGLGSRPWTEALRLYNTALHSGYETSLTTHAHALDALWRSNDSFQKVHSPVNAAHQQFLLTSAKKIKDEVASLKHLRVAGDEGCNYLESLVKVVAAAGDWESALGVLFDMDATPDGLSHRLLVPTAETFAFAMIACNVKGNATHSYSLQQIFKESYSWRSLHSEVLLTYLQSLRHITRTAPWVGEIVEELVKDGNGLDCPCAIACLQLLSASAVRSETPKARLARTLFDLFDANAYTQQPLARKIELQTLFRCCYVIESREGESGSVMNHIRQYYTSLFGPDSAEVEWIDDTEVYALQSTPSWEKAMEIFERQVMRRPREKVKYLPVPLRQVRWMCCHTLLNCCRSIVADADSDEFLLDDEAHQSETQNALEIVRRIEHFIKVNIHDQDISVGAEALSEIKLLGCLHETNKKKRVATATEAMNELAFAPESSLTPSIIALLSRALEVAELNLTTVVKENHAAFRGSVSALDTPDIAPLEKVYL